MQKCTCTVLLLVTMVAGHIAEASQTRGRMLLQETTVTYKKTETAKGSSPASFKADKKSDGEWKVVEKETYKKQGPSTYSYKKTYPEKETETTNKSEYKGTEKPVQSKTSTKDGTIFVYKSGKRHFEYTESSKTVKNFPVTEITASGGTPAEWSKTKTVTAPTYESKVSYNSGDGPTYKSEWTLDVTKGKAEEEPAPKGKDPAPKGKDPAPKGKEPAPKGKEPAPKHRRRSL